MSYFKDKTLICMLKCFRKTFKEGEVLKNFKHKNELPIENNLNEFKRGFGQGIPIILGYIPVSFAFSVMAVDGGISPWNAIIISLTNLTSAGQFAGAGLIIINASLFEIASTVFVINIRYMLMSLSLAQKITKMPTVKRCIMAFGITDEIFTIASLEKRKITFSYMMGLISGPYFGWALGTVLGAVVTQALPKAVQDSMGIALYGMFIALFIPAAKKSKAALVVVLAAVLMSSLFKWMPIVKDVINGGWGIIIATIVAAMLGAILFPREDNEI